MVEAILVKPLDGKPAGEKMDFSQADFDRLEKLGAVKAVGKKAAPEPENKMKTAPANKGAAKKKGG